MRRQCEIDTCSGHFVLMVESIWCIGNVKWICVLITQVYHVCSVTSLYGCMELAICCFNLVLYDSCIFGS